MTEAEIGCKALRGQWFRRDAHGGLYERVAVCCASGKKSLRGKKNFALLQLWLRPRRARGAAKVFGKLKSFNRKPQACALGMDGSLSAVSANTHACGLQLNDLSARQEKLPLPRPRSFGFEQAFTARQNHDWKCTKPGFREEAGLRRVECIEPFV